MGRSGKRWRTAAHGLDHAFAVAVGGVDGHGIHPGLHQGLGAQQAILAHADGPGHQQPSPFVLGGCGIVQPFEDVFVGDQPLQAAVFVHQGQLFDAIAVQDLFGLGQGGAHFGRHQLFGHHIIADGAAKILGKAHIPVGENAHQPAIFVGDGHAADAVAAHQSLGVGKQVMRAQGEGVHDHARLAALDLVHLFGLVGDAQVAVDHAQAALPGQGNGQLGLADRVHGRAEDGNVQAQFGMKLHADVHLGGQDFGVAGDQQHIVKGEGFFGKGHGRFGSHAAPVRPRSGRDQLFFQRNGHGIPLLGKS